MSLEQIISVKATSKLTGRRKRNRNQRL